jgi:hypothetical protein
MGVLFGRKVELHLITESQVEIIGTDYDISFEVYSTSKKEPNTANVTVAGLSETQRALFSSDLQRIEIWAGYESDFGIIFNGSWDTRDYSTSIKKIKKPSPTNPNVTLTSEKLVYGKRGGSVVKHTKADPVWQTEFSTGEGLKETQTSFFSRSYPAGTTLEKILEDLFSGFGLPIAMEFVRAESETLLHSATFTGKTAQILDDLAWSYKFDWMIQNGSVVVTERDEPSETVAVATVLSHSTGLVGDPIVTADGIECTTMMLPNIKPKGLIEIKDETVPGEIETLAARVKGKDANNLRSQISQSGIYVVDEITYYGDNRGGDFNCTVKALFK